MFLNRKSPRRLAVAADIAEAETKAAPRYHPQFGQTLLIAGVFFLVATAILYWPRDKVRHHVGEKATADLLSPVDFVIVDQRKTADLRQFARDASPPVLVLDSETLDRLVSQLYNLPGDVGNAATPEALPENIRQRWPGLTPETLAWLHNTDVKVYQQEVTSFVKRPANLPLIDASALAAVDARKNASVVSLVERAHDKPPEYALDTPIIPDLSKSLLVPLKSNDPAKKAYLRERAQLFGPLADCVVAFLLNQDRPLFRYDAKLTALLADRRANAVEPLGEHFTASQVIVPKDATITPEQHDRLNAAQNAYESELNHAHPYARWLWRIGEALVVLILTAAGTLYVTQLSPQTSTIGRGWALAGLLLITLFIAKGSVSLGLFYMAYLLGIAPTLLTTVILIIAFERRFALGISALHGLLVTLAINHGLDFYLTMLTGIALLTFGLSEIRTRGKLIEVGAFTGGALMASVWALGAAHIVGTIGGSPGVAVDASWSEHFVRLAQNSLWAALAGLAVGFVTLGILPFIEKTFKITTAMTLLELCDLNQPLLRRLAAEAPGTFNHSLVVGTLAESAGNAIGANGLLCRVGAYYHDIGKLSKPQYFIENQSGGPNRHDKLSPAMSLLIIVGHVKDGIELAREYALPWVVHQFIAQHHGSTLVEYFFHAAKKAARDTEARGDDATSVSEAEFRYPGPRPQTRETAILMICDGCESIVRAMAEPTAGRIETAVHQLIMKRLMDGQFSDCDLTLRELSLIEQALIRTLAGVYHGRVAYPKPLPISQPA